MKKAQWKAPENTRVKIEAKKETSIFIYIITVASEVDTILIV